MPILLSTPPDGGTEIEADWLSPLELSERFGVSRRRVYDWISFGWLRASRSGHRWRVSGRDAAFFEATCRGYRWRLMPSLYEWESLWGRV
jgi:excisionase family DNA binding protein